MQGIIEAVDFSPYLSAVSNLGPNFFFIVFAVVALEYINGQIKAHERKKKAKIRADNRAYNAHVRKMRKKHGAR